MWTTRVFDGNATAGGDSNERGYLDMAEELILCI